MSFARVDGVVHADAVALPRLADAVGTPFYVYSAARIRAQLGALTAALQGIPHRIHFAMKANACRGVLEVVHSTGAGVDVVSGGELDRARRAGFAPDDILFGGVGGNMVGHLGPPLVLPRR